MRTILTLSEFNRVVAEKQAVLAYFSHEKCSVCKTLKPKLESHFKQQFPKFELVYVNIEHTPEISGQFSVFASPTLLIFFNGKESLRKSRNFGIDELSQAVSRPYSLLFD